MSTPPITNQAIESQKRADQEGVVAPHDGAGRVTVHVGDDEADQDGEPVDQAQQVQPVDHGGKRAVFGLYNGGLGVAQFSLPRRSSRRNVAPIAAIASLNRVHA